MQRVAIINSRQALRPTGTDAWVQSTMRAVRNLASEGDYVFLASLGETPYELTLYEISRTQSPVELVLTHSQINKSAESIDILLSYLLDEFQLAPERVSCTLVPTTKEESGNESHIRDNELLRQADIIVPISIRPKGYWEEQLTRLSLASSVRIDNRFRVDYRRRDQTIKRSFAARKLNETTEGLLRGRLIHWTRTANHPWPGEKRYTYYQSVCESEGAYSHSAFATLERILTEQRIRASSRHMPQNAKMVSLTSATLSESVALMKYRARYREMTIEPYAITLPLSEARQAGIRPVTYCSKQKLALLPDEEKLFAHAKGSAGTDWKREKEWRYSEDFHLAPVWNTVIALTETEEEALRITDTYAIDAYAMFC